MGRSEEEDHETIDDKEHINEKPENSSRVRVQLSGLHEKVGGCENKKKTKRKLTGKKVKRRSKVNLEIVNKNFEISQKYTDPDSENYEKGKLSKVWFTSKEELKSESKITSKIKRKVTGKRRKSRDKDKAIDIALINKNYEISHNETSPRTFEEGGSQDKDTDSMNVQDESKAR